MENFFANAQIHERTIRNLVFFLTLIWATGTFGQSGLSTVSKKAQKLYIKADKKYKERDFELALQLLNSALTEDPKFYEAYLRKGSLFTKLGIEDSVFTNFVKYAEYATAPSASILEKLAHMSFDRGKYLESREYLGLFLVQVPEKVEDREIKLLDASIQFSLDQLKDHPTITVNKLPDAINKYGLQYLPSLTVDEKTMVYTKRDEFHDDEDIVTSQLSKEGKWTSSQTIHKNINTPSNEGAASISADGRTMIFTACDSKDSYGSCDLYITTKTGDNWSRPKNLGKAVNTKYWESQPSISADGNTLYFTSNRPGGFGGRDIWLCKKVDNQWQKPVNLGKQVNSFKNETTPFIHFNNKTLYFSSNSYVGMGGYDLFSIEWKDSLWVNLKNLGFPINTYRDEVAIMVNAQGSKAYFSQEDEKNKNITKSNIVEFDMPKSQRPRQTFYLTGRVLDKQTMHPVDAKLQIVNLSNNQEIYNSTSDATTGQYYLVLPANRHLAAYVKKEGYLYQDFNIDTKSAQKISTDTLDIMLTPVMEGETLILHNIYFQSDSYLLDKRSQSEIDNVVELLNINSTINVEIGGHTDDIGSNQYNLTLSEKRAEQVYKRLVSEGISPKRLTYKGFGFTKPIRPNDSEANRQSNRRIEFRVLRSKQ